MKTFLLLFLFLLQTPPASACQITGTLTYCNGDEIEYGDRLIAISKDGKVFNDKIKTGFKGKFEIKDLTPGTYVIGYDNIFGQRLRKTVTLSTTVTQIDLCVDEFVDTNVSTLFNTMQEGDTIVLHMESRGCFHGYEEELSVCFKSNKYTFSIRNGQNRGKAYPLDRAKLNQLIRFEKIIRYLSGTYGGCTTTDSYVFTKNGQEVYKANDNTCSWNGFVKIREQILGLKDFP